VVTPDPLHYSLIKNDGLQLTDEKQRFRIVLQLAARPHILTSGNLNPNLSDSMCLCLKRTTGLGKSWWSGIGKEAT
jgi:hypothetical protein